MLRKQFLSICNTSAYKLYKPTENIIRYIKKIRNPAHYQPCNPHYLIFESESCNTARICCTMCLYLLYYVCIAVLTLDAGLLARSQYPEGPATGHLDTGLFLVSLCL